MSELTYTQKPKATPIQAARPKTPVIPNHATASGGGALDTKTQREMGARFGHDFSQVRIHTDARAAESAQAMSANAYAVGSDIVFGPGRYAPGSPDGDRLLAHELTHVVQQSKFGGGDWDRTSLPEDASEREADSIASQVLMGQKVQVQAIPEAAIARDPGGSIWDRLKPGGSGILQGSDEGSWSPSDKPRWDPHEDLFTRDNTGSWMDKLFGLDRTKSFQESSLDGLLGPESYAHVQEGDSTLKTLSRAGYSVGAGLAAGVTVPASDLLDSLAYGPFGAMEDQIKQKPAEAHE